MWSCRFLLPFAIIVLYHPAGVLFRLRFRKRHPTSFALLIKEMIMHNRLLKRCVHRLGIVALGLALVHCAAPSRYEPAAIRRDFTAGVPQAGEDSRLHQGACRRGNSREPRGHRSSSYNGGGAGIYGDGMGFQFPAAHGLSGAAEQGRGHSIVFRQKDGREEPAIGA